ncbi:MAG: hypothetical protein ACLVCH_12230 [Roseburia inulinivorans]
MKYKREGEKHGCKTAVLKELETLYAKSGNQLCVLYGRPDLEKELLLKTFLQNKKAFYYRARYASPESQKQMMAEAVRRKIAGQAAEI